MEATSKDEHLTHRSDIDSVKAAVRANPQAAFEAILGESLVRKAGAKEPVGHCPFHDDEHPSLRCNLDKQAWFCNPCKKGGDVFDLAEGVWNVGFVEAATRLGGILGATQNGHRSQPQSGKNDRKLVRTIKHEIRDLNGELRAVHVRHEYDDGSKQMPWDPVGTEPTTLPLYGIGRTAFNADGEVIIVCEGEKAADSLMERGHLAVGTVTGSSSIPCDESLAALLRFKTYLWADNDDPGRAHMGKIAKRLMELGHSNVYRITWPEAPEHGDAADFQGDVGGFLDSAARFSEPDHPKDDRKTGWDRAISAPNFLNREVADVAELARDLAAPGSVTALASPRGLGKTHIAHALAVAAAMGGGFRGEILPAGRVLLLDRDNSKREVSRRLRAWGALTAENLKVLTRDEVPPLTDAAAWDRFPFADYDLVVLDSLSAATEGVKEADGGATGQALAPLLDLARRGPAVLVLANTRKDGEVVRGSGVIGDRFDIVYEVRDATDLKLDPKADVWWECLPESDDTAWSSKAKRRRRRDTYRLALVPSKYRLGEEPNPWAVEISLADDRAWTLRDVTPEIEAEHGRLKGEVEEARDIALGQAVAALKARLPQSQTEAEAILMDHGLKRPAARNTLKDGIGTDWIRAGAGRKSDPFTYSIYTENPRRELHESGNPCESDTSATPFSPLLGHRDGENRHRKVALPQWFQKSPNSRRDFPVYMVRASGGKR